MTKTACLLSLTLVCVTNVPAPARADDALSDIFATLLSPANSLPISNNPMIATDIDHSCEGKAHPSTPVSLAPVALDSGVLHDTATLYQVKFDTSDWSGDVISRAISSGDGSSCSSARGQLCAPQWSARAELQTTLPTERTIITNRRDAFLNLPDLSRILDVLRHNPLNDKLCKIPLLGSITCRLTDALNDLLDKLANTVLGPLDNLLKPATLLLETVLDSVDVVNPSNEGAPFHFNQLGLEQHLFLGLLGETTSGLIGCGLTDTLDLLGRKTLEYIRGSTEYESSCLRPRGGKLGDMVHSNPVYVGPPAFSYPADFASKPYDDFAAAHANRAAMVYVGANDGMLHAFNATTGQEALAFVPAAVFPKLYALRTHDYTHKYYVDGGLTAGDVFFDDAWHTVLVGTLGAGGQSVYALDITTPLDFSEKQANAILLWEFMDSNDADLGYVYGQPSIVKLANGHWAAVFGNGFNNIDNLLGELINNLRDAHETTALLSTLAVLLNPDMTVSTTGNAVLYIVDIATGELLRKLDTQFGTSACHGQPNGLGEVTVTDFDGDRIADTAYAGDLCGNLWKFDLSGNHPAQWHIANGGHPLFSATRNSQSQPITAAPTVPQLAATREPLVIFGTGRHFLEGDSTLTGTAKQSLYAVRDDRTAGKIMRQDLVEQEIIVDDDGLRVTSNHRIDWSSDNGWFMDLPADERLLAAPLVRGQRVMFTTMIPAGPCRIGGKSWLYTLDYATGGRLRHPPIDTNGDGRIDGQDLATDPDDSSHDVTISGIEFDTMISSPRLQIDPADNSARLYLSDSAGQVQVRKASTALGRKNWQQLR